MEQKRPADIFQELLDYLWNGLGLEEKGWKRLKKGDFKKKMKNGLIYQICFDRNRYNYIDYEIGHGNVEVGFTCIIKQGDDWLYSFKIESTTGGSFFRMLTEDLQLNTGLLDTFLPLIKVHYLDFINCFEEDPTEALQTVCAPFTQPEDYSWYIYVREQMVEPFVQAKRQTGQWTQEDEAGYQLYRQEADPEKRTFRVWYLIANPRGLPKEFVQKELEFQWKLFANRPKEKE